jgi:hypothetical protein
VIFTDSDGERLDELRDRIAEALGDDNVIRDRVVAEYNRLIKKLWDSEAEESLLRLKTSKQ